MSNILDNNKRIAKNTFLLYFRMSLTMVVTLYTSRVILNVLGVEDFGIFNIVGGVIAMLSFLNGALSGASSRFITFSLGKGDIEELKKLFSTVLGVHLILAGVIFLLSETIGLWFVCNKLVIPVERMTAALWVYQFSFIIAIVSIINVPYYSLIIAHERMNAFAYISIVEVILKLCIVWLLILIPQDKLIVYAILYLIVQVAICLFYSYYCFSHFKESRVKPICNPYQMKELFVYTGWTMNGYAAIIGYTQGVNILLNIFFGPMINAARGVAVQVQNAVMTFVQNFQMAIKPQIIKSYAVSDLQYMHTLVTASSRYGFFLLLIISLPLLLYTDIILRIWLGVVPEHTAEFVRIMLFAGLLQPLNSTLVTSIHATGDIKKFQIYEGTSLLTVVPISYILLKFFHISAEAVMAVYIFVEIFTQLIRVWIILPKIGMSYSFYFKNAIVPIFFPFLCLLIPFFLLNTPKELSFIKFSFYSVLACVYMIVGVYLVGLDKSERKIMKEYLLIIKDKLFK